MAEDADREADQHQRDVGAGALREQRRQRRYEVEHGRRIIIARHGRRLRGRGEEALAEVGYLADEPAALVSFLAQRLGKPVLVEGPAGVGKTELAKALSRATGRELVRLQCYEGLDEAKAMYEWNYRKQLLRIQAGGEAGWDDVQEDIFCTEFLLERPLMQAISSPEPVVLLIDEIDKTDQEFEAMLLELLSDFQITIPELGQISATTMPIVVLTSNDSRELTEALKRRCLYLWLDYPGIEREMEIVRLHAPELPETLTRRLVEVIDMVRALDLKKPPSIAESIDWARTLVLMGADDIDRETFQQSMSIIVKHRTDIDLVAERVGMKLARAGSLARRAVPFGRQTPKGQLNRGRRRVLEELLDRRRLRRAVVGEPAFADADAAAGGGDHVGAVGGDDDRGAGLAGLGQQLEEDLAAGRVEAVERLVGEQHRERPHQAERDRGLLPHAVAEFAGQRVLPLGEAEPLEQEADPRLGVLDPVQGGDVAEVLAEAEVFVEDRRVGDVGEGAAGLDRAGRLAARPRPRPSSARAGRRRG